MIVNRRGVLAIFLVATAAVAGGTLLWRGKKNHSNNKPVPSEMLTVTRGGLKKIFRETGEAIPKVAVEVHSKVSGRILDIYVREGQVVRSGDRLALLQPGKSELDRYVPVEIAAPIGGVVLAGAKDEPPKEGERFLQPGDYVAGLFDSTKATPLMTIADMREMAVELKISEMEILKLKPGLSVTVKMDALLGEVFSGVVESMAPRAMKDANDLKVFRVVVGLSRPDERLRAGMTARVEAVLASRSNALKVPLGAIYEEGQEQFVYAHSSMGPKKMAIVTGIKNELEAEVLSGLSEGDSVYPEKPAGTSSKKGK
ncbi:MAG: HlyD family efflux transporter periplasmic adaptor subunit [Elusimicrobia bacterium]|nr:HlyD family efflux transporter periplasmic adaptor subunit [Elusimicrobiota bacterium]